MKPVVFGSTRRCRLLVWYKGGRDDGKSAECGRYSRPPSGGWTRESDAKTSLEDMGLRRLSTDSEHLPASTKRRRQPAWPFRSHLSRVLTRPSYQTHSDPFDRLIAALFHVASLTSKPPEGVVWLNFFVVRPREMIRHTLDT